MRHHAILEYRSQCYVFWTRIGDRPERILVSRLDPGAGADWRDRRLGEAVEVHRAEHAWEGADLAQRASTYGAARQRLNQLRDPAIFVEGDKIYLLYACAGEQGIAIGDLRKT